MNPFMSRALLIVLALLAVAAGLLVASVQWLTELWWFQEVGFESVFWTRIVWPWAIRLLFGLLLAGFFYLNLQATRAAIRRVMFRFQHRIPTISWPWIRLVFAVASLVLGFLSSATVALYWDVVARYVHRVGFGLPDPLFGLDLSFFVFQLPFFRLLHTTAMGAFVLALFLVGAVYGVTRAAELGGGSLYIEPGARRHLLLLGAGIVLLKAVDYRLQQYELVYSERGVTFGAGHTDVTLVLPALTVMVVLSVVVALLLVLATRQASLRRVGLGLGALLAASILLLGVLPAAMQQYIVNPNEIELERPFIERGIEMSRFAYDLDRIEERDFPVSNELDWGDLQRHEGTVSNVRLWDWRPMLTSFRQLQEIRFYYSFPEIDLARYRIDGQVRQVMTAARELDISAVPNRTWINEHLQYTHGYGFVMSPVNESTAEGLPRFFLQDIPPRSSDPALRVDRPEVYYGELTDQYVLVRTRIPEFDYPMGDDNAWTTYEGRGGIPVGNMFRRIVLALRMGTSAIVLSNDFTPETRLLMRRNIHERVREIAPFLRYDGDPYLVLAEGRLFWIQDAYTTAAGLPYAQPVRGWGNYVRNSVKIVIDAYHGDTTFYAFDSTDPVLQVYRGLYPDLFTAGEDMPASLREHVRYPEDLFTLQARMYSVYHMTNPTIFYNQEDVWHIPREIYRGREQEMSPYYTILQLPDGDEPEMVLLLPFTPARRNNMIAWLAARNDGANYGRLIAYQFPKDELIFGPMQIEARIDQDPSISEVLTLWDQSGSQVVRGNLLVLPIQDSLLYVKPIFLRADTGELPELVRVIVAFGSRLVMMPTLEMALAALFGEEPTAVAERGEELDRRDEQRFALPEGVNVTPEMARLAGQALVEWRDAQDALRQGDWAAYGDALARLERLLEQLNEWAEDALP